MSTKAAAVADDIGESWFVSSSTNGTSIKARLTPVEGDEGINDTDEGCRWTLVELFVRCLR